MSCLATWNLSLNCEIMFYMQSVRYVVVVHLVKTKCLYPYFIMLLKCVQLVSPMFCPLDTSLILASEKYSIWNRRRLCTNVKPSLGCYQSVTLLTVGKVNFSWSMTIPITCYASCAKIVTKLFDFRFRVHRLVKFIFHVL